MAKKPAPTDETVEPIATKDPTLEEAHVMFEERPDLDAVRTQSGWLTRDGVLTPILIAE